MRPLADGCIVVSLDQTRQAMRIMAEKARVISEGGRAAAGRGADGEGRSRSDRGDRLGRQYRPEEVRRADRCHRISVSVPVATSAADQIRSDRG
jgi:hypothetical protein